MTTADEPRLATLREHLVASGAGIYLAAHQAGPLPAETIAAMHASDDLELRLGRVGPDRADDLAQRDEEARAAVAAAMHVTPDRLVLTHGVGEAARLVLAEAAAARWRGGGAGQGGARGRVVALEGVEAAIGRALEAEAEALGLTLVRPSAVDGVVDPPAHSATATETVLVAASHVDDLGRVLDVPAAAARARASGAWLLIDASRSCGALADPLVHDGTTAVVTAGHRWLLGPEGVAALWLAPELGRDTIERLHACVDPLARSTVLGLARSVGWLLMYVGMPWVVERTEALAARLRGSLAGIEGVELLGGAVATGPLMALRIRGWPAADAAAELARRPFAVLELDDGADLLRASVGAWLREAEVDRFAAAVADLARHTPQTMPRRPALRVVQAGEEDA